jgi:hypothetical protein
VAGEIERLRREAVSESGKGIVLMNQAVKVGSTYEIGPLLEGENGSVIGAGVRTGQDAVNQTLGMFSRRPVAERARLRQRNYASTLVNLDGSRAG